MCSLTAKEFNEQRDDALNNLMTFMRLNDERTRGLLLSHYPVNRQTHRSIAFLASILKKNQTKTQKTSK